jgi:hypothetical protein
MLNSYTPEQRVVFTELFPRVPPQLHQKMVHE